MINWLSSLHPRANLRRRNSERKTFEKTSAKWIWKRHLHLSGTRNHDELRETRQFFRVAPRWQLGNVVRANQIKNLRLRKASRRFAHRINRVRHAAALEFLLINLAPRFPR